MNHELESPCFVYDTREQAEQAIQTLDRGGVALSSLSLIGKGCHSEEQPVGFYTLGDKVKAWGAKGAFWGGIWGLLLAPAVFFLPGIGVVALAGPVVLALVGVLEGAAVVGGLSALGAALSQLGLSKALVLKYETALKVDKYLLLVHGSAEVQAKARGLLPAATLRQVA